MESLQLKRNSICSVLEQLDQYFIKIGRNKLNLIRFEVGQEVNYLNLRIALAFERILNNCLEESIDTITDEFLEKIRVMINKIC